MQSIDYAGYTETFRRYQVRHLYEILAFDTFGRLIDWNVVSSENYSALEMLQDMRKGIWKELNNGVKVDVFRRNLQRAYIERMAYLMTEELNPLKSRQYFNVNQSDIRALVRGELNSLKNSINRIMNSVSNIETKYHYQDAIKRIELILDPKK
jgi:hypothetical protein